MFNLSKDRGLYRRVYRDVAKGKGCKKEKSELEHSWSDVEREERECDLPTVWAVVSCPIWKCD